MTDVQCVKWKRRCEVQWEELEQINERLRFCHSCNQAVHRVSSQHELERMATLGRCVALIEPDIPLIVGRPAAVEYACRTKK